MGASKGKRRGGRNKDRDRNRDTDHGRSAASSNSKPKSKYEPRPGSKSGTADFVDRSGRVHGKQRQEQPGRAGGRAHAPAPGARVLKATVDKNRKGFGFLIFEDRKREDVFVPPREAENLFHGDRVEVTLNSRGELFSIRVLAHRFREIVGRYTPHPVDHARGGWVVYEQRRAREEVYVERAPAFPVRPNDWVRAKLRFHEKGPFKVTAEILENFGSELPPSADVGMISAEFNLIEEHPEDAEREAREARLEIPGRDLEGRTDLREVPFITIDGETARDFDDAVFVERLRAGYLLWVAIADVSHYVREGSALDKDALSRGTSVYFPERAFHMLPRALSENLCSLRPNEPRLALVAQIEFDRHGKRIATEVMEAVIQSRRRATYNEIEAESKTRKGEREWEYAPHFELFGILKKTRIARGSIDFDLPEAEVVVKPTGEVVSITQRARLDAHRLIEEFMIAANEAVTDWMMKREWPFVYRIHEEPALDALARFEELAAHVGVRISLERGASPKVLADVITRLEGHPAQALLNMALLRSLKQAIYSSSHGIHFGLASEGYTHFTSPIRRYPDLVVHRLLRAALRNPHPRDRDRLERELAEICEHCSYRERLAADADREAIKLKQVRAMVPRLGDEFDAKIVGMIETGFFIQLADPYVEGMVARESMTDDFYQFNEERMIFAGRRKKRMFRVGDPVRVRAVRADVDRRQIDFMLAEFADEAQAALELGRNGPAGRPEGRRPERQGGGRGSDRGGPHRGGRRGRRGRR